MKKTFYLHFCMCLLSEVVGLNLKPIFAASSFNVTSTSYDCNSNIICVGDAHTYTGICTPNCNNIRGIEAGRLSLLPETWAAGNPDLPLNAEGIAYYNGSVRLLDPFTRQSASFNTSFSIDNRQIYSGYDGDGMAFVISADHKSLGGVGQNFGMFNGTGYTNFKSVVVEFDQFHNSDSPTFDINNNHVSVDFSYIDSAATESAWDVGVNFSSYDTIYAWVEYSNASQSLEVRVSHNNSRPIRPLLNYTVNLFDVVEEYMWVGFSASNGEFYGAHYIGDWSFESYGIPEVSSAVSPKPTPKKDGLMVGTSVGIPVVVSVLFLACVFIIMFTVRRSHGRGSFRHWWLLWMEFIGEGPMEQVEGMPERFSSKELSIATGAFSEKSKLGQGGFGIVYQGVLPSSGLPVAVKKINANSNQGQKEFMAEVSIINQLRHRNLIQLKGWCQNTAKAKYMLVYELMPNGSLDKVLFGPTKEKAACLSWSQRFNIVTGTAAAIDYLHRGWNQQVIHRDIKSSNILLDDEWNPKLGDFGLARLVAHEQAVTTTMAAGTYGYIAPEVACSGKFTDKSDVYAFGAVVLEVVCGRKAVIFHVPPEEAMLVDWVWKSLGEGNVLRTVDKKLGDQSDTYWMEVVLKVGLLCSHPDLKARPSMRHVIKILAGDAPVPPVPPCKPALVFESDFHGPFHDVSTDEDSHSSICGATVPNYAYGSIGLEPANCGLSR